MKLRRKLSLAFVLVMLVPLLLVSGVSAWQARRVLEATIGAHVAAIAHEKADAVATIIRSQIAEALILGSTHEVREAVREANASYAGRSEESIRQSIDTRDAEWIARNKEGGTQHAMALLANPLSMFLLGYQNQDPERYGEILLTDERGAVIGQTRLLSDYDQADEAWWQECFDEGKGRVFLEDRGFDQSVGALVMGVAVPVYDGPAVVGVLKIAYKVRDVLRVVTAARALPQMTSFLVRSPGMIVAQTGGGDVDVLTEKEKAVLLHGNENGYIRSTFTGTRCVLGYCLVDMAIARRVPTSGARKGISGERWTPSQWWLFVQVPKAVAMAPLARFSAVVCIGAFVALLFCIVVALVVANSMSKPLRKLHDDMAVIGGGDLDHRAGISSKDEVGELSRVVDQMVADLKSTMASRDELNLEVAQRRRVEAELARSNLELEQFGYSASHDLQEPLRKIIAFSERVVSAYGDQMDEKHVDYLARVQDAGHRMQALIDALLAYSRVTTKAKPFETVDLAETAKGVLEDLEYRISESRGEVRVKDLPVLDAEPVQMRQLVQNLIGNALKFSREGVPPLIEVYGENVPSDGDGEEECRITVRDNGIGFDLRFAARIFQVFQRLHGRGIYEGTGIGLALCKKIVDRHGGSIAVHSTLGEGTVFTVTLPKKQVGGS